MIQLTIPVLIYERDADDYFNLHVASFAAIDPDGSLVYYTVRGYKITAEGGYNCPATEYNISHLLPNIRRIALEANGFVYSDLLEYKEHYSDDIFRALAEIDKEIVERDK